MQEDIYCVLGNEVRVKLLLCLSQGEKTVSELVLNCGLAQSAVSQHLQKLRACNMVVVRPDGREKYYSIADNDLILICSLLHQYAQKKGSQSLKIA
ncbi:winged helix-turn-helix transcriptional regulator [Candidatus Woesebacteria bacterium]|nr:winged helix-turn-helix transcriptional regulator [Candidatus Woesebacteria bacterium]